MTPPLLTTPLLWRVLEETEIPQPGDEAWNGESRRWETVSIPSMWLAGGQRIAGDKFRRPMRFRPMSEAPRDGTEIECLVYHRNRRYAKKSEKPEWADIVKAHWIDHNGGGWTWRGMMGQFRGWRHPPPLCSLPSLLFTSDTPRSPDPLTAPSASAPETPHNAASSPPDHNAPETPPPL